MSLDPEEIDCPEPLKSELGWRYRTDLQARPEIDQAILNRARAKLARREMLRPMLRMPWLATAAAILVIALMIPAIYRYAHPRSQVVAVIQRAAGDVNGDGVVDIRDALALARKIEAKNAAFTQWDDVNGDKIVDRRDVDAAANLAVRINPGAVQ